MQRRGDCFTAVNRDVVSESSNSERMTPLGKVRDKSGLAGEKFNIRRILLNSAPLLSFHRDSGHDSYKLNNWHRAATFDAETRNCVLHQCQFYPTLRCPRLSDGRSRRSTGSPGSPILRRSPCSPGNRSQTLRRLNARAADAGFLPAQTITNCRQQTRRSPPPPPSRSPARFSPSYLNRVSGAGLIRPRQLQYVLADRVQNHLLRDRRDF